ncbi:MAG: CinA family nicotinamide mononucleotide deamidase-related protein [Desulfobulbia bacterium]
MQAEIITIGTEILLGQIVDTNSAYLAKELAKLGFDVHRKSTVGDNKERIAEAVRMALDHCDVVITSGGIGPTIDDKTREGVAIATDSKLVLNEDLLQHITDFFERRGLELGVNNSRQAYIPENATPIHNPVGTAPGFIVKFRNRYVITLPGVPRELHHLMAEAVLPFIHDRFGVDTVIKSRVLRTASYGESYIDRHLADLEETSNPTVGLLAYPGAVDIRIAAKAQDTEIALQLLDEMEGRIRQRLGDMIFGTDEETLEEIIVQLLRKHQLQIAVLETNTGGRLADRLTGVAQGFDVVKQIVTMPFAQIRASLLVDPPDENLISTEVAETLAKRIRENTGADIGLALIGDQDPKAGPYSDRIGNTYVCLNWSAGALTQHMQLGGISTNTRTRITNHTLEMLRKNIQNIETAASSGET